MTSMVQTDLGPPPASSSTTAAKYKEDPVDDSLRHPNPAHHQPSHHPHSLHHPRPTGLLQQQKQRPNSPHQPPTSIPPVSYATSHPLGTAILQHQTPYGQHSQEPAYYPSHPSAYTAASGPGPYPSSGPPDLMAATQMQRPYPPIYHTSQSSPPASVAAQTHDQHGRNIYTQSPQIPSQMYGYQPYSPMNPVPPSPYAAQPPAPSQQHPLTSPPLMVPHQTTAAPVPHHQSPTQPVPVTSSPSLKLDTQPAPSQRTVLNPPHPTGAGASISASNVHPAGTVGTTSSAAPGPIPATTPLVVRQDSNGVQWIAFEYSRERIKLQYTIRCDVESVNVDSLSQEFKNENCVYPRACCSKDQYRGNRLVYETECNAVGWALAELNPSLRGKRGLIQRAVDSWRNSNQDPRLRSRRVRRMAKLNRRQAVQAQTSTHMVTTASAAAAVPSPVAAGLPGPSLTAPGPRPAVTPLTIGSRQLHHHHAQPEGNASHEEVSGNVDYVTGTHRPSITSGHPPPQPAQPATDIRTAQIFHGYPAFPPVPSASAGPSIPPLLRDTGVGPLSRHPTVATSTSRPDEEEDNDDDDERNPDKDALFGNIPDGKRRKFILVDDTQRGCRVRVRVMLDQVDMDELPDSYRLSNSVYPRTYFPVQMKGSPGRVVPGKRYFKNDSEIEDDEDEDVATVGRTLVPAPSMEGESEIAVPKISRSRRKKDILLNDLGYRMSWSQSRVFAGRMLFLQRSLDAYRNKMRSTMLTAGQDPSSVPRHFETRLGKRRWLERGKRNNSTVITSGTEGADGGAADSTMSASKRSAEEVEG